MSDKLITIATFSEPVQAELAKAKLQSENIKCFLVEDAAHSLYGYAMGKLKLQTMESDSPRAMEILATNENSS